MNRFNRAKRSNGPSRATAGAACAALALVATAAAFARPIPDIEGLAWNGSVPDAPTQRGGGLSLQQAIELATSRYEGRVVRADTMIRNGRLVHEIRILGDDGRVRTVQVDAQSGELR